MRYIKQAGLTLVELMISLAIGVFLLGGITAAYIAMRTTTAETVALSEVQQNGRMAISLLTADIQQAGFRGMLPEFHANTAAPAPFAGDCTWGLNGGSFPQAGLGNFPAVWGRTLVAGGNAMGCVVAAVANSDVIQIKRGAGPAIAPAGIQADRFYLESSMSQGVIFPGTAAAPGLNQGEIWPYLHHVYFVTTEQFDGQAVPVLSRMELRNNGGPTMTQTMMLDGIERIRFYYGVDLNDDQVIDSYLAANAMPAALWQADTKVLAVRVFVLARATRPDSDFVNNSSYDLGDGVAFAPNDNFRRMLFSTTVNIAN
ncbi:PilW family protein [Rheinheimera fenheensis]|uniref:PilW family protein n=1 Tax=Rheinheimera fenheensis TaxID=3152295 RepID=UPI003261A838